MSLMEVLRVAFLAELVVAMPVLSVWIARQACKRIDAAKVEIIGHVKAAGLASAALDDEFGPPPPAVPVEAGVQAGRHREMYVVGSNRPARRVMAMVYRLAAG